MFLYLMVTNDKWELPLSAAETPKELSMMTGFTTTHISSICSKYDHGVLYVPDEKRRYKKKRCHNPVTFRRVKIDEMEE